MKAGGAERRGEVEGKRDLLVEKVKDDLEEISHLEQEEARLSKVEQQVNTLQQEKINLQARSKLLEEKREKAKAACCFSCCFSSPEPSSP